VTAGDPAPPLILTALPSMPEVQAGDDLALLIADALRVSGTELRDGDILVVAQKIVSKSEGRTVDLREVEPSQRALDYARVTGKDARYVEVVLRESVRVVRAKPGVLIVEHRHGYIMANAGIDRSNLPDPESVLLLPEDAEAACRALRARLRDRGSVDIGIVISDSFGRPWRNGVVGSALGVAGVPALVDLRGQRDRHGRALQVTQVALADAVAAAAAMLMGEGAEGTPVVHARGVPYSRRDGTVRELLRPAAEDLFR
jgi:coenzyme F420-0:L-glutamate ligase/coenzyme F420-1:gamma-L-glutamate ligase